MSALRALPVDWGGVNGTLEDLTRLNKAFQAFPTPAFGAVKGYVSETFSRPCRQVQHQLLRRVISRHQKDDCPQRPSGGCYNWGDPSHVKKGCPDLASSSGSTCYNCGEVGLPRGSQQSQCLPQLQARGSQCT
ncbi:hypothetical protein DM02DRAFT_669509 [Periconia macrospinosa]|uniref:CCHC-type domain-containing protein n=1 Tax=Periconia macrospinosa TaxID=97972 RepID=A0A2V1E0G9_9PLEO|nr:hypothetical protein DM02DRAFT_669509 [Periconia macrospinosa]